MTGLRLHTSNRIEILVEQLAGVMRDSPPPPMTAETVVVQSMGMQRYLSIRLAQLLGVSAHIEYPFPNAILQRLFGCWFPESTPRSPTDPAVLVWRLLTAFRRVLHRPGFERVREYPGADPTGIKTFELAEKLADRFDQYTVFRPDMVLSWSRANDAAESPEHAWQAELWREVFGSEDVPHRARLREKLFEAVSREHPPSRPLPARIFLFGMSTLPRLHLEILQAVSTLIPVHVFLPTPTPRFWDDIVTEKAIARRSVRLGRDRVEGMHLESGNPLLASLGTQGREFHRVLHGMDAEDEQSFEEPTATTALGAVQRDLYNLETPVERETCSPKDRSIRIHVCHNPRREVEVLHDYLLDLFDSGSGIAARDVLIMAPDIEEYAPYIKAVFDHSSSDSPAIPYSIADTTLGGSSRMFGDFMRLLSLDKQRFSAAEVVSLLESGRIRKQWNISEADLSLIRHWVADVRIRWGMNADDRAIRGNPRTAENTWEHGLDRLILGALMRIDGSEPLLFRGVLPYDTVEAGEAETLGILAGFVQSIGAIVAETRTSRRLEEWSEVLQDALETVFGHPEATDREYLTVLDAVRDLVDQQEISGYGEVVSFDILARRLESALSCKEMGRGFLSGGVTFCSLLPMRSVPMKMIGLLGMNDTAFPRSDREFSFDIVARSPVECDRNRRKDDRYLFLEAILSAREALHISYVGRSAVDNTELPWSVVVGELADYLDGRFVGDNGASVLQSLTVRHHLHGFAESYFKKNSSLFSYSRPMYEAALAGRERLRDLPPFVRGPLGPADGRDRRQVTLDELTRFYKNPAAFFVRESLGMRFPGDTPTMSDDEPFVLEGLDRYSVHQQILENAVRGVPPDRCFEPLRQKGVLPHGMVGQCVYDHESGQVDRFLPFVEEYREGDGLHTFSVETTAGGLTVVGRLDSISGNRLVTYRFGRLGARERIVAWIQHLLLNCTKDESMPRETILLGVAPTGGRGKQKTITPKAVRYRPVDNPSEILDDLVRAFVEGLYFPYPFAPNTSWTYAERKLLKEDDHPGACARAERVWDGSDFSEGERKDPYYAMVWRDRSLVDDAFAAASEAFWKPLLEHEGDV